MKNACKREKCELCVKQTKAPGNMEFMSTKACCKLLLVSKIRGLGSGGWEGGTISRVWETVAGKGHL